MPEDLADFASDIEAHARTFLGGSCTLDLLGQVSDGTALEDRFFLVLSQAGDREPLARSWWNFLIGLRAAYAHEDPWNGLVHGHVPPRSEPDGTWTIRRPVISWSVMPIQPGATRRPHGRNVR